MSTPNMGLALPVDHGSADAWDTILDAVFGLVDAHDHTAGKGVLVPMAALNVNADLLFSAAGVSRAITSLRAIDFSPQPAAGMAALAGAFFLSDGSSGLSANELYYRTTAGVNVKFTSGSALNVAGFAGGIGGDYAAAGALVVFDDATDAYWFQQQLGASVRQYARMRSADLDLFEYKAQPAAGVPTNRVRLASPTALAASYALTLPPAAPSSTLPLEFTAAGVGSFGGAHTLFLTPASGVAVGGATTGLASAVIVGTVGGGTQQLNVGIPLIGGKRITAVRAIIQDTASGPTVVRMRTAKDVNTGSVTILNTATSAGSGAIQTITITGLALIVGAAAAYGIIFDGFSGTGTVFVYGIEVDYDS